MLKASGYAELRAEQAAAPRQQRRQAARHRRVDLRRGHRAGRAARRVRRGRDPRRRHRQRVRRHQRARPGPSHRVRDARQRGARHPDGQDHPRQLRHRPRAARRRHDGLPFAADRGQRDPRRVERGARPGPQDRQLTCSRPRPTTSSSATAACTSPACPPTVLSWAELAVASRDASKLPDGLEPGAAAPRARLRRHRLHLSRSARTCRWSRSTPRPARSRCSATSPSTTAAAS